MEQNFPIMVVVLIIYFIMVKLVIISIILITLPNIINMQLQIKYHINIFGTPFF